MEGPALLLGLGDALSVRACHSHIAAVFNSVWVNWRICQLCVFWQILVFLTMST